MTATETAAFSFMLVGLCDGGSSSSSSSASPHEISCYEYQLMIDIEIELGGECTYDDQCDQVIPETGVGCETDDVVIRYNYDGDYLVSLVNDADAAGCTIDYGTSGACPADGEPACVWGTCGWQ